MELLRSTDRCGGMQQSGWHLLWYGIGSSRLVFEIQWLTLIDVAGYNRPSFSRLHAV